MPLEIERKFLVRGDYKQFAREQTRIIQGYLSSATERTVRIRIKGDQGYISVKGPGNKTGMSRYEWEKEIPVNEARELLQLCEPGIIDKTRYHIMNGNHLFEVDEFYGDNEGLVVAEIELTDENEQFEKPDWIGKEVTGNNRYYNSMLTKSPFKYWDH